MGRTSSGANNSEMEGGTSRDKDRDRAYWPKMVNDRVNLV